MAITDTVIVVALTVVKATGISTTTATTITATTMNLACAFLWTVEASRLGLRSIAGARLADAPQG